ncbi:ATP-binding protein [Streptomyces misionensis]|uniref:ATP-binding protein n=2 Tax=Streptomyces misionensis TaxID=67331 RepID=A0A5C6IRP8_9ACTN|nr:ATP-binding protein [Streptomyces misionensis]
MASWVRADAGRSMPAEPPATVVEFDGGAGCIAAARHHAARFLGRVQEEHGIEVSGRALDLTQLVVSEVVTNACKYAPGPVRLGLRIAAGLVEISVWDRDPALPVARAAEPSRVGQHGLEIVLAVAETFEARREGAGKRVTARVALADTAAAGRAAGRSPGARSAASVPRVR